jgi:hypothetical protein
LIGAVATVAVAVAGGLATLSAPDLKAKRDRRRQVRELEARYSDSLLRSADALQSRFWNIAMQAFSQAYVRHGADEERFHAITSTLWLVGQYFCWVELLRRDAYSLALGGVERGKTLLSLLARIEELFSTDQFDPRFRLWRAEQSALGELMIAERGVDDARRFDCLGYATFVDKLQEEQFKRWFARLEDALTSVDGPPERLAHLQNALVDLVEFLHGGEVPGRERIDVATF